MPCGIRPVPLKPGFHMVALQSSAISAIAATTVAEIEKVLSQRPLSLRSLEGGFHMIAAIAIAIFVNDCSDRSDHVENGL